MKRKSIRKQKEGVVVVVLSVVVVVVVVAVVDIVSVGASPVAA